MLFASDKFSKLIVEEKSDSQKLDYQMNLASYWKFYLNDVHKHLMWIYRVNNLDKR